MSEPKSRRIPIWFGIAAVLVVCLGFGLFATYSHQHDLTTEFALRKKMLGMTRQSVESEIGVGILADFEQPPPGGKDLDLYVYPMLYDASLYIVYENDRAAEITIRCQAGRWEYHP